MQEIKVEKFIVSVEHYDGKGFEQFVKLFNIIDNRLFNIHPLKDDHYHYLILDIHHIINDGASLQVLLHDIEATYNGNTLEPEALTLAEVALAEKQLQGSQAFEDDKQWYAQTFNDEDVNTSLRPDQEDGEEGAIERELHVSVEDVEAFCKQNGIYKNTLMTTVYAFLLAKYNHEQTALTRTVYNGRTDKRLQRSIGILSRPSPFSASLIRTRPCWTSSASSRSRLQNAASMRLTRSWILMNDLRLEIDNTFVWHGELFSDEPLMGYPMATQQLNNDKSEDLFYVKAFIVKGHIHVRAEYDGVYSKALVCQFVDSYEKVLQGFLTTERLSDISLINEQQLALLDSFNQTEVPYDPEETVLSCFRQQVSLHPDKLAVVFQDKRYTYQQVDNLSDRIAGYLIEKGLGREDVVSILIPRCEWMLIASLGVLKAGCAYQPLDPTYPEERLQFMQEDAGSKLLLTLDNLPSIVEHAAMSSQQEPRSEDLFILLYTSGSTGVPKGCQLEHRNLVAFCHWYQRYYELTADCKVAAYASYGFDACMMDMYPAITCSACVHIIGDDIRLNLPDLNDYFNKNGITHSFITTQVGYQFATNVDNHSLRYFSVGGEKLSALQPPKNYKMYNGYGPTECTIFTTTYQLKEYEQDIPIGKPTSNTKLYIVDKQLNRLPPGAAGELWVSGPQVGRGYLNRPEKNAEVFVESPWGRCYRTGDIVRYLPDGNIQFVGRKDSQVKIRGFRIELKEVESIIHEYEGIKDATVQAFDYPNGGKYIAAYIVSDQKVDIKKLHTFIGEHKPPYMIPAATMQIDTIPLNQNQKVNRKMLPAPVIQAEEREYVAPANEMEQLFCRIFGDILSIDKVGATDNFFEMGGTSLMVTRVIIEADKAGRHIAYGDCSVIRHPDSWLLSFLIIPRVSRSRRTHSSTISR